MNRFFFVFFFAVLFVLQGPLGAGEIRGSLGAASYQMEGKGPGGFYGEKPSYNKQPYVEAEYRSAPWGAEHYWRLEMGYMGGERKLSTQQALFRKVETMSLLAGWSRIYSSGIGFELGPAAVVQRHELWDLSGGGGTVLDFTRLGSYFGLLGERGFGLWQVTFMSHIGVLGGLRRESAFSAVSLAVDRPIFSGAWIVGAKGAVAFFQAQRRANRNGDVGSTPGAVLRFKNEETDSEIVMLTIGRKI